LTGQFTGSNDELADPARYQYREAFVLVEAVFGLPVSTTHILSSGTAGTMVANGSGIQKDTVRNIVLAWVLTLPVCVLLGAALFFVLRVLGVH
jgi:phosphate/sulfate permease